MKNPNIRGKFFPIRINIIDSSVYTLAADCGHNSGLLLMKTMFYRYNNYHFFPIDDRGGIDPGDKIEEINDENILVFTSPEKLSEFLINGRDSNMRSCQGYSEFIDFILQHGIKAESLCKDYNVTRAGELLENFRWKDWTPEDKYEIKNNLQLLESYSRTISIRELSSLFRKEKPLANLSKILMDSDMGKIQSGNISDLSYMDSDEIYDNFATSVGIAYLNTYIVA